MAVIRRDTGASKCFPKPLPGREAIVVFVLIKILTVFKSKNYHVNRLRSLAKQSSMQPHSQAKAWLLCMKLSLGTARIYFGGWRDGGGGGRREEGGGSR